MHAADVKNTLRVYSIEVAARERDDLNEDPIVVRLRKVRFTFRGHLNLLLTRSSGITMVIRLYRREERVMMAFKPKCRNIFSDVSISMSTAIRLNKGCNFGRAATT